MASCRAHLSSTAGVAAALKAAPNVKRPFAGAGWPASASSSGSPVIWTRKQPRTQAGSTADLMHLTRGAVGIQKQAVVACESCKHHPSTWSGLCKQYGSPVFVHSAIGGWRATAHLSLYRAQHSGSLGCRGPLLLLLCAPHERQPEQALALAAITLRVASS